MKLRMRSLILALGLLAVPLTADAQQDGRVYRIGLLGLSSRADVAGLVAFRQGLRDLGYERADQVIE